MKIALYGGSFNPAHIGHHLVASLVLATADVDELWFVPTYKHMLGKNLLDFEHRLEMCRIMAKDLPRASVSRAEQRLAKVPGFIGSKTVDLVRYLQDEWPNDRFRLVIGSDLVESSRSWEEWDVIEKLAPPIVVSRAGYAKYMVAGARAVVVPDVSSTDVKAALGRGEDVSDLMPRDVLAYIEENGLYKP